MGSQTVKLRSESLAPTDWHSSYLPPPTTFSRTATVSSRAKIGLASLTSYGIVTNFQADKRGFMPQSWFGPNVQSIHYSGASGLGIESVQLFRHTGK